MKVLHVNTYSSGGAFNGMYRLHLALLKQGIKSKVLVKYLPDIHDYTEVYCFNKPFRKKNLFNQVLSKIGFPVTSTQQIWKYTRNKNGQFETISFPFSDWDITESNEYKEADIINLHWVGDYLDFRTFFKKNKKNVVWTLRDSYPFQGIFHLQNDLERNNDYWKKLNNQMILYKKMFLRKNKSSIAFVGISNYIKEKSKASILFNNYEHHTIYNCIDTNLFNKIDKSLARSELNIDEKLIVFCFAADTINRFNKGFKELKTAIEMLPYKNVLFLSVGEGVPSKFKLSVNHRHLGKLANKDLSLVYAASDAFIFPTKEESLGNVMLEAMACGTPVIGTPVGGLPEVIKENFNGVISKDTSSLALKDAIEFFLSIRNDFNSDAIRDFVIKNFNEDKISSEYILLYKNLSKKKTDAQSDATKKCITIE